MKNNFDVVIIGGGPGGYAAAIRCAQIGVCVALIEKDQIGGTCVNRGCVPSKALLGSARMYLNMLCANELGIDPGTPRANWNQIQKRKDGIVDSFKKGVIGLLRNYEVEILEGLGIVKDQGKIELRSENGIKEIFAKKIILATGSSPMEIPGCDFDNSTIISSTEALNLRNIPQSMCIIGGGAIGCELACIFSVMGCRTVIVEAERNLLPREDPWIGASVTKEFRKRDIDVLANHNVSAVHVDSDGALIELNNEEVIRAEKVLVAIGRKGVCDEETIRNMSLKLSGGAIKVDKHMKTCGTGIYAIGDVVGTTYLAHGAFMEGFVAAFNASSGSDSEVADYSSVPRAVYSFPEIACVGKSETQCADLNIKTEIGRAFFRSNARSVSENEVVGEIRVIREKDKDLILGISMVGSGVTEMISFATMLLGNKEHNKNITFAHPTSSEVFKEAYEDSYGRALHLPPKKMVNRF